MNPATDWSETIPPEEAERNERLAAKLRDLQLLRAQKYPLGRGLHYKAHGGLRGELEVLPDLPEWARVGIFAAPGCYRAYVRFSNGAGHSQPDKVDDVRGFAVKVVGVPGEKLIEGMKDAMTQDFLAILTPSLPFASAEEFVAVSEAFAGPPWKILPTLLRATGWRRLLPFLGDLKAFVGVKANSLTEATFYTPAPIRWGDYAVKYSFVPENPTGVGSDDPRDPLRVDLANRLRKGGVSWVMRVQPYVNPTATPIEDNRRAWDEAASPWVNVARLSLPTQDPDSEQGRKLGEWVERLSFDPWHAPVEFRPLGEAMRARSAAYRESTIARKAAPEPDGSETI